jgi:tRNA(Ile)-lysidine synthase TilS/MesJ
MVEERLVEQLANKGNIDLIHINEEDDHKKETLID